MRLYAEDPAADYQPQSGRLTRFEIPDVDVELSPLTSYGVRLDSGFRTGDEVGTHYDAMLAKVDRLGARPAHARCGSWPGCCGGRACTVWSPTATCWSRSSETGPSWPRS